MALKYVGGGAYIIGVPARDLTDEEEKQHGKLIREQEKACGLALYEKADAKPASASGEKQPDKGGEG